MYWLKDLIGEEAVDAALRKLIAKYAFKAAPYPSTTDLLALLKQEAARSRSGDRRSVRPHHAL